MPTERHVPTIRANATIEMLERAIAETRDSNRTLREAVEMLHAAIFGRADADPARSLPGLQNSVIHMRDQIDGVAAQLLKAEKQLAATAREVHRIRWWISGGMAAATIILSIVDIFARTHLQVGGRF